MNRARRRSRASSTRSSRLPDKTATVFGFENERAEALLHHAEGGALDRRAGRRRKPAAADRRRSSGDAVRADGRDKVQPPKLVREVKPIYPEVARKAGVEGVVIMEATTDTYGRVAAVKVLRSIPSLDQAAVDAVRQWVYEPMVIDGRPRPVVFTVTMRFSSTTRSRGSAAVGGVAGGVAGGVEGGIEGGVEGGIVGGVQRQDIKPIEGDAVRAVGDIKPPKLVKQVESGLSGSGPQGRRRRDRHPRGQDRRAGRTSSTPGSSVPFPPSTRRPSTPSSSGSTSR